MFTWYQAKIEVSVYSGFNIWLNHNTEEETQVVIIHQPEKGEQM